MQGTIYITEPISFNLKRGAAHFELRSGGSIFCFCMSIHDAMVSDEQFRRELAEWSLKQSAKQVSKMR